MLRAPALELLNCSTALGSFWIPRAIGCQSSYGYKKKNDHFICSWPEDYTHSYQIQTWPQWPVNSRPLILIVITVSNLKSIHPQKDPGGTKLNIPSIQKHWSPWVYHPVLHSLHWLLIEYRVHVKVSVLILEVFHEIRRTYLRENLSLLKYDLL